MSPSSVQFHPRRPDRRWPAAPLVALGLYLMLLGTLGGIVIERVRFDRQRTAVLSRYQHAIRQWQAEVMSVERQTQGVRSRWGHDNPASSQR